MRKALLWPLVVLAASAAAGAGLAAQGAEDPVVAAAFRTERAGSAGVSFRTSMRGAGMSLEFTGGGLVSGRAARLTFRFPRAVVPAGDPTAVMIFRVERGAPVVYMRAAFLQRELPRGKRWARIDLAQQARKAGLDLAALTGGAGIDASSQSALLRHAARTTRLGTEPVLGERMTRYRVEVDLEKAARRDPRLAPALRQLVRLTGRRTLIMEAWVDSRGYLRRLNQSVRYGDPSTGLAVRIRMTLSYLKFGLPVTIKAPPAGAVVDLASLAG